jgi:hypothetical protein
MVHVKDEDIAKLDRSSPQEGTRMKIRKELWFGFIADGRSILPRCDYRLA